MVLDAEAGDRTNPQVALNGLGESLKAKEVVAVRCDLQLEDGLLSEVLTAAIAVEALEVQLSSSSNLDLETESEAKVFEFLMSCENE